MIDTPIVSNNSTKLLTLKVDYLTNTFEGAIETEYNIYSPTFTVSNLYTSPGDFGYIQLKYQELNEVIFSGSIIWMGLGQIQYPINLLPSSQFDSVNTNDIVNPVSGFEDVFNPYNQPFDYSPVWLSIQKLVIVREYLQSNPNATIKLFLYMPSVGFGNPADADWFIFLKK